MNDGPMLHPQSRFPPMFYLCVALYGAAYVSACVFWAAILES